MGNNFWGVVSAIVTVALVTTIVASPTAASTIMAIGQSFAGVLSAAMGGGLGGR